MINRKRSNGRLGRVLFGPILLFIMMFGLFTSPPMFVYADPVDNSAGTTETTESTLQTTDNGEQNNQTSTDTDSSNSVAATGNGCQAALGAIGWLVCPTTGAISGAVDFLYGLIQDFLNINPVEMKDGTPIYEIWKYCRGFANIAFIILLLVVIYSQLTGVGISNYGIKKVLPKLIVVSVLMNLSFLLCSMAVDASNVLGSSLRGLFNSVEETTAANMVTGSDATGMNIATAEMFGAIAGGSVLAIGGTIIAFETGAIWMLIPMLLGALIAVVTGLITIALRQAVVALLIMISPLAVVAYMLPNTDNLFNKWRKLFVQMLVFYPMFSLLFGAASLAGFAIIASAHDGFALLLGVAVQIIPLFFAWKLMQMSGTFLGDVNSKIREWTSRPMNGVRSFASSKREASRQKHLADNRPITPSLRLMQFAANRRVAREAEAAENAETIKNRGLAYRARRNYNSNGTPNKRAEESYANQAKNMKYQQEILRDRNNMEKGLGQLAASKDVSASTKARLAALDNENVQASDALKFEQARGEKIAADNAAGFYARTEAAINWHIDEKHGYARNANGEQILRDGERIQIAGYKSHFASLDPDKIKEAATRYDKMSEIMEGNPADVQFAAAGAAHAFDTQKKIVETKYQKYFEMTPPSKDVDLRLSELTKRDDASNYIDSILPGLRVLSQRGDTDVVRKQVENILNSENGIELGTHASQSLANFLMFDVKDSDPYLRRYGKYINMETAQVYNSNKRQNTRLSLDEYITGEYQDWDPDNPEVRIVRKSKKSIVPLMEGTPLDNLERTAFGNLDDMLKNAYTDSSGNLDVSKYLSRREEIEVSMGPAYVSASLKYLSGSEQIKNAVTFLTGISDSGEARWQNGGDLVSDAELAENYFRKRTMEYIKAQTPAQILGMRSDYKTALTEHLVNEFLENNPEAREAYNEEVARIQASYGDENNEEAKKHRQNDLNELRMDYAGRQMREILGDTGKLEQIYETRSSGAANNAKDWLRKWVNLDNENALKQEVDYYKAKREREWREEMKKRKEADPDSNYEDGYRIYDTTDQASFQAEMSEMNDRYRDIDTDEYFERTRNKLNEWFPDDFLVWSYEKYYQRNANLSNEDLYDWLDETLADLDNYPGYRSV